MVGMWKGYLTIGFYDNDQPGEVFIKISKQGTSVSGLCDIIAVQASMMLQHGFTWKQIADKWLHTRFEPHGVGYNNEEFTSLMDCIAKAGSEVISTRGGREDKDCHDLPEGDREKLDGVLEEANVVLLPNERAPSHDTDYTGIEIQAGSRAHLRACTPYERGELACAANEIIEPPVDLVTAEAKLLWIKGYLNESHGHDDSDGDSKTKESSDGT